MDGYRPPARRRAFGDHRAFKYIYIQYIFSRCGLASLGKSNSIFFNLYTIYQSCHEPVILLMLHAVSLDQLSMKIVLKEGRGSQLSDRHKPATVKNIDSV